MHYLQHITPRRATVRRCRQVRIGEYSVDNPANIRVFSTSLIEQALRIILNEMSNCSNAHSRSCTHVDGGQSFEVCMILA